MWLTECPYADQGVIRPMVTDSGDVILICDVGAEVWLSPDQVATTDPRYPDEATGLISGDIRVTRGTTRWATWDDLTPLGWDVDWHPGPADHPD